MHFLLRRIWMCCLGTSSRYSHIILKDELFLKQYMVDVVYKIKYNGFCAQYHKVK